MENNTKEGTVDLQTAIVVNEPQFLEFIHEEIDAERVVPIISASTSWETFGTTVSG